MRAPTNVIVASRSGFRDIVVTGSPEYLAAVRRGHAVTGELVAAGSPHRVAPHDPRLRMVMRLRVVAAVPVRPAPRRRLRLPRGAGLALVALAMVTGVVSAAAYVLGVIAAFVAAYWPVMVGGLVVLVLVLAGLARLVGGGSCPGLHCPGPH